MINGVKLNLRAIVRNIIETDKNARRSDGALFLSVLDHICTANGYALHEMTVANIEEEVRAKRLPTFDQVQMERAIIDVENTVERVLSGG
jgi:hypothetical protein